MTSNEGIPIGESSPWWVAAVAYLAFIALAVGVFAYLGYALDQHAWRSGVIAACQKEGIEC